MLQIHPNDDRQLAQGDFSTTCDGEVLEVPAELAGALQRLRVRTGEEFVSLLNAFPSAFAAQLGWTIDDVDAARSKLVAQLGLRLPPQLLENTPPPRRYYGAMPPARG